MAQHTGRRTSSNTIAKGSARADRGARDAIRSTTKAAASRAKNKAMLQRMNRAGPKPTTDKEAARIRRALNESIQKITGAQMTFDEAAAFLKTQIKTAPIKQWTVGREFNRRMKRRFDELGIEIPFPHTTIYFGEDKHGAAQEAAQTRLRGHHRPAGARGRGRRRRLGPGIARGDGSLDS